MKKREWNAGRRFTGKRRVSRLLVAASLGLTAALVMPTIPQMPGAMPYVEAAPDSYGADSISDNSINTINRTSDSVINDDDRAEADADMLYYMQSLEVRYRLDEKMMENRIGDVKG